MKPWLQAERRSVQRAVQPEGRERRGERQILVFDLSSEELGLDLSCVREVLRPQEIFPLPRTPGFIEGVINLRGHIVALIDLQKRLSAKPIEEKANRRIIVCKVNRFIVGLIVNNLREIITLSGEDIRPVPEVVSMQMDAEVLSGVAKVKEKIIPILDLERILTKKEVSELSRLGE
ncbi:MAG: purine-binding chemotaxis protein CheW [Syntrophaceae bacterium]|nr:purine-binding chemotaxis protein CheW [Syntrophaceae bacterium]